VDTTYRAMPASSTNPMQFLLDNPMKLYRDCLRVADALARRQGYSRETLRANVRAPWRANQRENDEGKINALREGAIRGITNYMMHEAARGAMEGVPAFVAEDDDASGTTER